MTHHYHYTLTGPYRRRRSSVWFALLVCAAVAGVVALVLA